jgi:hypothetical protein
VGECLQQAGSHADLLLLPGPGALLAGEDLRAVQLPTHH